MKRFHNCFLSQFLPLPAASGEGSTTHSREHYNREYSTQVWTSHSVTRVRESIAGRGGPKHSGTFVAATRDESNPLQVRESSIRFKSKRDILSKYNKTSSSFAASCSRNLLPGHCFHLLATIKACSHHAVIMVKVTAVTHTRESYRILFA